MDDPRFFQSNWQLDDCQILNNITIAGSPNRSARRLVLSSGQGKFIAEAFDLRKKSRQIRQNELLEHLVRKGMKTVFPWLRTVDGAHGIVSGGCFWQLRPWCDADPLPRERLGDDPAYAKIWSGLLLDLQRCAPAEKHTLLLPNEDFTFAAYLPLLERFAREKSSVLYPQINALLRRMTPLCKEVDSLPQMFAHGDFHPGNILVCNGSAAALIDWEFCGWKPAGYDLALLLGCLGMDNPRWLSEGVIVDMQQELYRANFMPRAAWEMLTLTIAATRLGWLGEWLDLGDQRMAEQELSYINDFLLG